MCCLYESPNTAGPGKSLVAAAAAALSSLVANNEHAQDAARNVGALEKLLRSAPFSELVLTLVM